VAGGVDFASVGGPAAPPQQLGAARDVPGGGGPHLGAEFYKSKGNIITLSS